MVLVDSNFILGFLQSAFLNALLSIIGFLSMQMQMFAINFNYPVNLMDFFNKLFPLMTFSIIPTDKLYELMFRFTMYDDQPLNEHFDELGYSSSFSVVNMGSMFLIMMLIPLYLLLLTCASMCTNKNILTRVSKRIQQAKHDMLYNNIIKMIDSTYLAITVISYIQL